jgi:hypothetical protein
MAVVLLHTESSFAQSPTVDATKKAPAHPVPQESNPFPDDTSTVPLMPSKEAPADVPRPEGDGSPEASHLPLPSQSTDPMRSPDDGGGEGDAQRDNVTGTSSSSSQAGMDRILPSVEGDDQPQGKHKKGATAVAEHQETSAEDIQVGDYYLDRKNWKAALSRFESAMVLAPDDPEVYWGLAESERHLGKLADARTHYQKVAEYDPDSKHGKEAIRALKDPEIANARATAPTASAK